jgi:DNA-binding transcriptional LysR family regulator
MSDRLQELSVFVRAAETGSFSKVAREFGMSQPSVSRMVASLEGRLGVKLLLRTTRRVALTDPCHRHLTQDGAIADIGLRAVDV